MVTNSFQEQGLPIWEIFCLPARSGMGIPCMVMGIGVFAFPWVTGVPACHLKFWPRKQNFLFCLCAHPAQRCGIHKSPYQNWDSLFSYGDWNDINPRLDTRIIRYYRMVTGIHNSPYRNGVSPFPYGDCKDINPHMDTGITRDYHIETGTGTSPYGNGTWPLPYGDQKQTNPCIDMGITTP